MFVLGRAPSQIRRALLLRVKLKRVRLLRRRIAATAQPTRNGGATPTPVNHAYRHTEHMRGTIAAHMAGMTSTRLVTGDNLASLHNLTQTGQQFDIVYLDPPYGTGRGKWCGWSYADTGAADWAEQFRTRLDLVAKILAPDGAVAVSIGSDRLFEAGLALKHTFTGRRIDTITVAVSGGVKSGPVRQTSEYLLLATPQGFVPGKLDWIGGEPRQPWEGLTLAGTSPERYPNQCYPIIVAADGTVLGAGDPAPYGTPLVLQRDGRVAIWPTTSTGKPSVWRLAPETFIELLQVGMIKADRPIRPGNPNAWSIKYLPAGARTRINNGDIIPLGRDDRGALILPSVPPAGAVAPTMWDRPEHRTTEGTKRLDELVPGNTFPYAKPVGLLRDIVTLCAGANPAAPLRVLDVFAGSGGIVEAVPDGSQVTLLEQDTTVLTQRLAALGIDPS